MERKGHRTPVWSQRGLVVALLAVCGSLSPFLAYGFPPYRSTDAETADPWTLESRLGLFRIEHEARDNAYSSPLLRLNLGLPNNMEITSEFEYQPDEGRVADAAVGFKWVPLVHSLSIGMETLALLPVSSEKNHGAGVDALLLATLRVRSLRLHLNLGGFYDARPATSESGWKSSILIEMLMGRVRPGVEVFTKQTCSQPVQVLFGPGVIFDVGPFDLRAGFHVGLTAAATDFTPSLWITHKFPLR